MTRAASAHSLRRTTAIAALTLLASLVWACANTGPTLRPTPPSSVAPTVSPSAVGSILAYVPATPDNPTPSAPATATATASSAAAGGGAGGNPAAAATPAPTQAPVAPAPRPAVNVTIAAAGDIACDPAQNVGTPQDCDQQATANLIGAIGPTAVLTLGDNQYENGTLAAFKTVFDPTWGKYRSIMYPAVGNHEYLTSGASGYFSYFGGIAPYYSYNLGDWHMISLDSECSHVGGCQAGSAEEKWLRADLTAHNTLCTLVYWHEPRFSSGEHGDATQMTTIWTDLVAAHVDVVLSGHNHDYERFEPLGATGQPDPTGITEFVVGTGGKNHYSFTHAPLVGEVVRSQAAFGVVRMLLGPSGFSWRFDSAPGYSFSDSGSAACH